MAASGVSLDSPVEKSRVSLTPLKDGDVTTPKGFRAAGVRCGLRRSAKDLALVVSDRPSTAAGVFTRNRVKAAPVLVSQRSIADGTARAIIANSSNANACTGEQGILDAQEMASRTAEELGLLSAQVLVASTGVIGVPLSMDAIRSGIPEVVAALGDSGREAAEAIMTTDTFPKNFAVRVDLGEESFSIGGISKGAGMIRPDMATTLSFLTTDAAVPADVLRGALGRAIGETFNRVTVDGDTSTNDCVFLLANGASEVSIDAESPLLESFERALTAVCIELAKMLVRDGEGATKLVEIVVEGAKDDEEALKAAFTIAESPLVKTAMYGCQVNWGRIIAAAGYSGVEMDEHNTDIWYDDIQVVEGGLPIQQNLSFATRALKKADVTARIALGVGEGRATVWTSDLTEDYIRINGSYIS